MDGNWTKNEFLKEINQKRISNHMFYILVIIYGIMIIFGALGNCLVVLVVARKPNMRNVRNLFILNLAISDLLLCLITMPLTLIEIQAKYWPFGTYAILCKLIETLRAVSIFVSTISITAIAVDRYQIIVYSTRESFQKMGAIGILIGIWIFSFVLSSPMIIFRRLEINRNEKLQLLGIPYLAFCIEDWNDIKNGRIYYTIISFLIQYLLPILTISTAYLRIYYKLKGRIIVNNQYTEKNHRQSLRKSSHDIERDNRMKKTNYLLVLIATIFGVSWLPLNIFNILAELNLIPYNNTDFFVIYAFCHMAGMSSACSNPLLYGWLNGNFRKEFNELLCCNKLSRTGSVQCNTTELKTAPTNDTKQSSILMQKL